MHCFVENSRTAVTRLFASLILALTAFGDKMEQYDTLIRNREGQYMMEFTETWQISWTDDPNKASVYPRWAAINSISRYCKHGEYTIHVNDVPNFDHRIQKW